MPARGVEATTRLGLNWLYSTAALGLGAVSDRWDAPPGTESRQRPLPAERPLAALAEARNSLC